MHETPTHRSTQVRNPAQKHKNSRDCPQNNPQRSSSQTKEQKSGPLRKLMNLSIQHEKLTQTHKPEIEAGLVDSALHSRPKTLIMKRNSPWRKTNSVKLDMKSVKPKKSRFDRQDIDSENLARLKESGQRHKAHNILNGHRNRGCRNTNRCRRPLWMSGSAQTSGAQALASKFETANGFTLF
jgi:hypothetical protein